MLFLPYNFLCGRTKARRVSNTFTGVAVLLMLCCISFQSLAAISFRAATSSATPDGLTVPITFVGAGTVATANSGNVTPGLPAGTQVDDVLIAVIESRDASATPTMTGWTQISTGSSGGDHRASLFWRRATGGDPTTVSNAGNDGIGARIIAFRGVVPTGSPFDTGNSFTLSGNDNDIEAGAITTSSSNTMLVFTAHANNDFNSIGTPAGSAPWTQAFFTEYNPPGGGDDLAIAAYYGLRGAAGTQAAVQASATGGNAVSHGAQLALRPAPVITINVPPGTTTDDVMVAVIAYRDNTAVTITPPAGWVSQSRIAQGAGNANVQEVFTRIATGAEPASYTWTFSGAITGAAGGIASYSGVDTSAAVDVIGGNVTANGTSHTANSVSTTVADTMVISSHSYSSAETWTPPAGMTERVDVASLTTPNAAGISLEINDVIQAGAGATGNKTATAAGSADTGVAHIIALTPVVTSACTFGAGLTSGFPGDYFNNMTLTAPATGTRIDGPVDFNWANGGPGVAGIGTDNFSVRWDGLLRITTTDTYRFQTVSDDGVRLYVDNVLVIDNWTDHASTTDTSANVALTAGEIYDIRLEYYENGGQAEIRLRWGDASNGFTYTPIPAGPAPVFDEGLYYCDTTAAPLAEWRMDETSWNGTTGEVVDETGSYDGAAVNGAQTDNTSPAIAGSPGTCGYGTFDGVDDYVNVPNLSDILNDTASLTFWMNTTQVGNDLAWQAPGVTGVEESGGADDIFWGWLDASGNIGISVANDFTTKSNVSVNDGTWHHVVLTRDASTDAYKIYIDGVLNTSGTLPSGGTIGNAFSSIGRIEDTGGSPEYFDGLLDEVRVYGSVLSDAEVTQIFNDTHDCVAGIYIEANQVTLNDTTTTPTFTPVSFLQTYPTPPLVFVLPTNENTDPAAIRIRNVTTTGFEMAQVEPEPQDGRSVPMTVDYIAMTEGVFTLPDGRTIEAGTHTTQTVQHGSGVPGGEGWDTVNYNNTFANPSVLLQIQGFANEYNNPPTTTSRPWLTASIQNVGNTSFETALERSEVNDGNPATINTDETIAYLAIDGNVQGSFTAQGTTILYETIVSADNIQGWDNENCAGGAGRTVPFVNTYSATPLAIGHTRRHDGGDGGWIRRCSIDATQIGLAYEEDIFRDTERNHTTEQASVLVFSEAFCYPTCVGNVIDHYDIDFGAGSGITCLPVDVTITAKDSSNATVNHTSATTIDFVTSTGRGTWSSTPSAGTGTVTPGTPGNGDASYEFPAGEASVTIPLNYPDLAGANSETFSINITSAITETSGTAPGDTDPGDGTDDPTIDFFLTGIIYNNVTDGNNTIPTQISGKPSNTGFNSKTLNLQVVRATDDDPSVCTSIFGPGDVVGIELGAECKNPSTCAGRELNISNAATPSQYIDTSDDDGDSDNADSVASYELVNLEFGVNAAAEIVLNYPDAGQLELHARYELLLDDGTPSGEYATGISNNFIVRPFGFTVTDINAGVANPGGVTSTGGIFTTAGSGFSANVGAYLWQAADDDGVPFGTADDGIPDFQIVSGVLIEGVDITDNNDLGFGALAPNFAWDGALAPFLYLPTGGATGTLNNGTFVQGDFTNGQVPLPDLEYTEVGSMSLVLTINGYLGDGTLNFFGLSAFNGQSGETVLGSSNYGAVGRFIPWRFDVSANTPDFADSCTGFTYQEQTFYYNTAPELTLTAYAETGNTTLNYGGGNTAPNGFVKFTSSPALARGYADGHAAPPPPNASLSSLVGGSIALGGETDFDGVITLTLASGAGGDAFMYQKDIAEAPFNADVDVSFLAAGLTDSDGVCYDSAVSPGRCNSAIAPVDTADGYAITDIGNTELRFGRLNIGTAAGSELLPVTVPFQTEYFDGTNFIVNALDGCTSIGATDLSLDSAVQTAEIDGTIDISDATGCGNGLATATVTNDPFAAGIGELVFTLASPAAGCTGYIDISPQSLSPWLQYDWDDTDNNEDGPYDDDPHGRAEFGIFEGPAEYIYIREPW